MNTVAPLLAQIDAWKHLGDRFSGPSLDGRLYHVGVAAALFAGFFAVLWGLYHLSKLWREEEKARSDRPRSPFAALVRAHGLTRAERSICQQAAAQLGLADPAELFVRPETARPALAKLDTKLAQRLFC